MAFGDSITDGVISLVPLITARAPRVVSVQTGAHVGGAVPDADICRFRAGQAGRKDDRGRNPSSRRSSMPDQPEVVLLLEGVNAVRILSTGTQVAALRSDDYDCDSGATSK